jgi:hypothetical protein
VSENRSKEGDLIWRLLWPYIGEESQFDPDLESDVIELTEDILPKVWDQVGAIEDKLATAERRLERTCKWKHDGDYWETECGQQWVFDDGGPEENGAAFCYACGGRLVVAAKEESER